MSDPRKVPATFNLLKLLAIYPLLLALALPFSLFQRQAQVNWILSTEASGSSDDPNDFDALQKKVSADEKTRDSEFKETLDTLEQTAQKQAHRHPLDQWRLLDQSSFAIPSPERLADLGALQFLLVSKGKDGVTRYTNFGDDRLPMVANVSEFADPEASAYFEILHRGKKVFRFDAPVQSVAWVGGRYLVFIEPQTVDRSGTEPVQELSFIDLKLYRNVLGTGNDRVIPVFKFFRKIEGGGDAATGILKLDQKNADRFFVGGCPVSLELLEVYAQAESTILNQSIALASPQFYERAAESLSDLPLYFEKMTETAAVTAQEGLVAAQEMRPLFAERLKNLHAQKDHLDSRAILNGSEKVLPHEKELLKSIGRLVQQEQDTKRFVNRAKLLLSKASFFEEPKGPEDLRNALLEIAGSFRQSSGYKNALRALLTRDGMIDFLRSPVGKLGTIAAGAFLMGAATPDEVRAQFLYQSLDIARYLGEGVMIRAGLLRELANEATLRTFGWMIDFGVLRTAYLTGDRPKYLAIGLAAINATVFLALGIPHVTINAFRLAQDFRDDGTWSKFLESVRQGPLFGVARGLRGLVKAFIQRQERVQSNYLKTLADAEAEAQGRTAEDAEQFTPEQEQQVDAILAQAVERKPGLWSRALTKIKESRFFQKFSQKSPQQAMGLGAAIRHFFFSSASFTNAVYAYTHIWQNWFRFRTLPWHPAQMMTEFLYPQYRKVISATLPKGEVQAPTPYNGGLRNRFDRITTFFSEDRQTLKTIEEWEAAVLPIEARFRRAALKVSFRALVEKYGSQPEVLQKLFSQPGLTGMGDNLIPKLAAEARLYLQSLNDLIFENAMREYVQELEANAAVMGDSEKLSLNEIKVRTLSALKDSAWINASDEDVLTHVQKISLRPEIKEAAEQAAQNRYTSLSAIATRFKHGLWHSYQNSPQLARMQAVDRQLQNPRAVARAARAMIASNLIDKPMELAFAFLFLAGQTDLLLRPLHDEMFNNYSSFYLSKYEFWNGFASAAILIIGDPWVKLQQDELHEGSFDQVPEGEDAKLSYLRWFWKKFTDPNNTLWKNHKHYIKLIVPNIRPALTTYLTINLLTLGRFDLDMWFMGYFMAFVLPVGGMAYKIEQAFELSTGWVARHIPKELRAHPKIQEYLNRETSTLRIKFNFLYKIYENILGYWFNSIGVMETTGAGKRALTRIVSPYRFTPTEWMTYAAQLLRGKSWAPRALVAAVDTCVHLLTNGYQDLKSPGTGTEFRSDELPARNSQTKSDK